MSNKNKNKLNDHQIFDGGRPEFKNINERIFAALETDYDGGYTWDPQSQAQPPVSTKTTNVVDPERDDSYADPLSEFDY